MSIAGEPSEFEVSRHVIIVPSATLEVLGRKQLIDGVEWLIEQVKQDDYLEQIHK